MTAAVRAQMHVALLLALATVPDELDLEEPVPVAPRAPGVALILTGGQILTAVSAYGALMSLQFARTGLTLVQLNPAGAAGQRTTAYIVTGGMVTLLAGMAWLAWTQPPDTPRPKSPAIGAFLAATLELSGGAAVAVAQNNDGPFRVSVQRSMIFVITSGVAALAAGVAWLVWAARS